MATSTATNDECDHQDSSSRLNRDDDIEDDNPSSSSAAQCIRLHHLGHVFGPVYTHQCFSNEWISGYLPKKKAAAAAAAAANNHSPTITGIAPQRSYENHALATHQLSIDIALAPDCRMCQIAIEADPINNDGDEEVGVVQDQQHPPKTTTRRLGATTTTISDPSNNQDITSLRRNKRPPPRRSSVEADKRVKRLSQDDTDNDQDDQDNDKDDDDDDKEDGNNDKRSEHDKGKQAHESKPSTSDDDEYCDTDEKYPGLAANAEDGDCDDDYEDDDDCDNVDDNDDELSVPQGGDATDTRVKRLSPLEIRRRLTKALPPVVRLTQTGGGDNRSNHAARTSPPRRRTPRHQSTLDASFLSHPLGTVLEEFQVGGVDFCLTLATGTHSEVATYHAAVQRLAVWFIETADDVDVASVDQGGHWKVLYVFRKHTEATTGRYSLAGYMTLFHFRAPFRKPKAGIVVRICQVLLLPHYQRLGLGRRMMHAVYDLAHQSHSTTTKDLPIVEVNVEDPAPAFVTLRNVVDFERCRHHPALKAAMSQSDMDDATFFTVVSDVEATNLSTELLITPVQVHIVHELVKLQAMLDHQESKGDDGTTTEATTSTTVVDSSVLKKRYRLMVKKRLNQHHREEMGGRSKADAQQHLAKLFDATWNEYQRILRGKRVSNTHR